ncbi:MAG TPA: type IV pilus secretin PilQ [Elusimicrobiota bacterium]|nr:type IV pilus secretin PilQ [Elusimicrobiota bacterium]
MKKWGRIILSLIILLNAGDFCPALSGAAEPSTARKDVPAKSISKLKSVSFDGGRLVAHLDQPADYKVFSLSKPPRIVIEIPNSLHVSDPYEASIDDPVVKRIRTSQFQTKPDKISRIVVDVSQSVSHEAYLEGSDIIVKFDTTAASKPTPAETAQKPEPLVTPAHKTALPLPKNAESITGETSGKTVAAATPSDTPKKLRSKNLLAALPKHPVTLDFDDADIRDVLRVLAEMCEINIIYGPEIRGVMTIHLDQVPFHEAFNTILSMHGLVVQQMGENILRIMTPESLTEDRSKAITAFKTFTLNYATAEEMRQHLDSIRVSPTGKVTTDSKTNTIIITDTPEGLVAAERLIADLDQKPQQVMIEAKMVEITLTDSMELGIQWEYAGLKNTANGTQTIGQRDVAVGTPQVPGGEAGFVQGGNVVQAFTANQRGTGVALPGPTQAAITFGFINNTDLLTATLGALATKGKTKVLSSPKIITLNNQEAKIQVGSKIPFSITSVAATGVATQSFQFVESGIILVVKPTVSADNRIRVKLKPEVNIPGATSAAGTTINTRNAETEVLIRDGETLVIGGLIDEQIRESASKVPLLGDIPVLGIFFRNTSDNKSRTELLIFVTPRIIRD